MGALVVTTAIAPAAAAPAYPTLSIVAGSAFRGGAPTSGPATRSRLGMPSDVAVGVGGVTYVLDTGPNDGKEHGSVIEKISAQGVLSIVAGNGRSGAAKPGRATRTPLDALAVTADAKGNVFLLVARSETASQVVKINSSGILSVVAGNGRGGAATSGPAIKSPLSPAAGLDADGAGNLYLAGAGTSFGGRAQVLKITARGVLSVLAGTGRSGKPVPGRAIRSPLGNPRGLAVDTKGNVYVADGGQNGVNDNGVVEKITPSGVLSIVAGRLGSSGAPRTGPATRSPLHYPLDVDVDAKGMLYIADGDLAYGGNCDVVRVTTKGALSLVTGRPGTCSSAPRPGRATSSPIGPPGGVAVGPSGTLLIADPYTSVVERIRGL